MLLASYEALQKDVQVQFIVPPAVSFTFTSLRLHRRYVKAASYCLRVTPPQS